jgi:hypothetical protein
VESESPKVYALVSTWHNSEDMIQCIQSLRGIEYPEMQVVVRDNGSTDGSDERILAWLAENEIPCVQYDREEAERGGDPGAEAKGVGGRYPVIFIQAGRDLGYAGGNNVALRCIMARADAGYVWLLNNDTVMAPSALAALVRAAEADASIGMVGSKLLYYDLPETLQLAGGAMLSPWRGDIRVVASHAPDDGSWDEPFDVDFICGASLLAKVEALKAAGLMESRYFLYWEDADWGLRARRAGYRLVYCPESRVWHKEGATTGRRSFASDYYWVRNGLHFTLRHYPWFMPLVPLAYCVKFFVLRPLRGETINARAFWRGLADFVMGRTGQLGQP